MNASFLIKRLESNQVHLRTVNGSIRIRAPKGVLTPDMVDAVKSNKSALLKALTGTSSLRNPHLAGHKAELPRLDINCTTNLSPTELESLRRGLLGDVLDVFADDGVEILSLTRAGEPTWLDRHRVAGAARRCQAAQSGAVLAQGDVQAPPGGIAPPANAIPVRTTADTRWYDGSNAITVIPVGSTGYLVDLDAVAIPEDERQALRSTATRARERREFGTHVLLAGKVRFLDLDSFERQKS